MLYFVSVCHYGDTIMACHLNADNAAAARTIAGNMYLADSANFPELSITKPPLAACTIHARKSNANPANAMNA